MQGIAIFEDKLIIYGNGDLISDYEGIDNGYESIFRGDLACLFFPQIFFETGTLVELIIVPFKLRNVSLHFPVEADDGECVLAALRTHSAERCRGWKFELRAGPRIAVVKDEPCVVDRDNYECAQLMANGK